MISKSIIFIILNSVLNYFIFIEYLKSTNYSGGEVGMVPLVVMINSLIAFICSVGVTFIIKRFSNLSIIKALVGYNTFYLIAFIFWGLNPLDRKGFYMNVDLFIIVSTVVSMLLTFAIAYFYENYFLKRE